MLDHCSISHKGGLVLWTRSFTPSSPLAPVNTLVREALVEGRNAEEERYEKDGYAICWTGANELELIFVVAYQRFLQLSYVPHLLKELKSLFLKLFTPFLESLVASLHATGPTLIQLQPGTGAGAGWNFERALKGWDRVFDTLLAAAQESAKGRSARPKQLLQSPESQTDESASVCAAPPPPDPASEDTHTEAEIARNVEVLKTRLRGRGAAAVAAGGRRGPSGRKGKGKGGLNGLVTPGSGSDTLPSASSKPKKAQRKWGDALPTEADMASLDYSSDPPAGAAGAAGGIQMSAAPELSDLVDQASMGRRNKQGLYEVKDLDTRGSGSGFGDEGEEEDDILARAFGAAANPAQQAENSNSSWFGGLLGRLTGSKALTEEDLAPVLAAMKEHLMQKNVAAEIADRVCEGVGRELVGRKVGFKGIKTEVRQALGASITRILTPKTSTDLLLSIRSKLSSSLGPPVPYSMTFVGVNGVGKSTNLSKVAFWLLQNGMDVLIAACDTFRSGAVEQLRVHVRNLGLLGAAGGAGEGRRVELYEKGYGKDAAGIAREAIAYAKENKFDVVLIDTAGRMQDNEPLMRALAKLVAVNSPDKIIFVGEALVGNEAVDQLTKFDRSLRDFSASSGLGAGRGRGIDGMLLTKWDTVDDKVGAALSMTYVTGQPILFVGCGQTYTDLRQLRVGHIVDALLRD
ncbi:P-loop containing nucleoside triphosphate hydrolase protein [Calocera viscosa TUFC12733]|uniref:p-loop containing nucleoside triphosphate hydrolase protein n=1 Tax=Calocera viscosa (strain TUFC12733) TaxID=1330018 RepID=A0A167Q5X2_CALVF|nr:P-loop containing nucleoside triphosphate hydrolase protein [Calocera viscosa TUFC12733]